MQSNLSENNNNNISNSGIKLTPLAVIIPPRVETNKRKNKSQKKVTLKKRRLREYNPHPTPYPYQELKEILQFPASDIETIASEKTETIN